MLLNIRLNYTRSDYYTHEPWEVQLLGTLGSLASPQDYPNTDNSYSNRAEYYIGPAFIKHISELRHKWRAHVFDNDEAVQVLENQQVAFRQGLMEVCDYRADMLLPHDPLMARILRTTRDNEIEELATQEILIRKHGLTYVEKMTLLEKLAPAYERYLDGPRGEDAKRTLRIDITAVVEPFITAKLGQGAQAHMRPQEQRVLREVVLSARPGRSNDGHAADMIADYVNGYIVAHIRKVQSQALR